MRLPGAPYSQQVGRAGGQFRGVVFCVCACLSLAILVDVK